MATEVRPRHSNEKYSFGIILLEFFFFIRYCFDILIDKIFSYIYDSKRIYIRNSKNPLILESAVSIARRIRKRQLKSEEVVTAFIERIKEVNPVLNSIVDSRFDEALEEARQIDIKIELGILSEKDYERKPFLGVPFTTKESTAVKGLSYTFGLLRRKETKADFDADYVILMKKAGAICLGVSNIPPLNLWQETHNPVYGITNNPYNTTRNVGGSSGGESSILAAGGTPLSIGTDIGGSCRIPAFMCGVYGHKPTSHLIPTKGMTFRTGKEEQTMVVVGPITRYAEEIAPLLKVLAAENASSLKLDDPVDLKNIQFYYTKDPRDPFVSYIRGEMTSTLLKAINHFMDISSKPPTEIKLPGMKMTGRLWKYWMTQESNANFAVDIMNREGTANPILEIIKYLTLCSQFSAPTIFNFINMLLPNLKPEHAVKETEKLKEELLEKLSDNGVLLYPSAPWPASYHYTAFFRPWNFNLFSLWNVMKFPVTQVPMGLIDGLPVGIQVVAAPFQDKLCIAVAKELEKAFGGYVPPFNVVE